MCVLPRRVELPFDVTIERSHHPYPGEHRRAAALSDQQKRFHRGLPFLGIVFGLGEFHYVICGVAEGDQLLALKAVRLDRRTVGPMTCQRSP
jgi:hypothetical protein